MSFYDRRPSNWYDMDYTAQREWEDADRKRQRELQDAEDDARRAREDAEREHISALRRHRALTNERDEYAEEAGQLAQELRDLRGKLARAEQFIHDRALDDDYRVFLKMVAEGRRRSTEDAE
jgi:hypothetical protein